MNVTFEEELAVRGYKDNLYVIKPDQNLDDIKTLIDISHQEAYKLKRQTLNQTLKNTRAFLSNHFELVDVPFTFFEKKRNKTLMKEGTIHPFGLPIEKVEFADPFQAITREYISFENPDNPTISYSQIDLSKKQNELTTLCYTHEIVHTEQNHIKGLVEEYSNIEVLSIFLESLQSFETSSRLLYIHDAVRLGDISEIIELLHKYENPKNEEELKQVIEMSSYLESTLKAYKLLNIYLQCNSYIKKEILTTIQHVFNQTISVESLLNKYNITYENSSAPKELAKYIKTRR